MSSQFSQVKMKYCLHVSSEWFIPRVSQTEGEGDNSFTSFVTQLNRFFFFGKKDCLHNLIFLYFGHRARVMLGRWNISPLFPETRFLAMKSRGLSVCTLAILSSVHNRVRNIRVWHGALVIMHTTNPEPPELRINERSRYAMRVCLVYRQPFCRGTIWCLWKSIAISVYSRHVKCAHVCFLNIPSYVHVLYMYTANAVTRTNRDLYDH